MKTNKTSDIIGHRVRRQSDQTTGLVKKMARQLRTHKMPWRLVDRSCHLVESVTVWGGSVMVWGGIWGQERTPQVIVNENLTAHRYIDDSASDSPIISPAAATWCHLSAWQHQIMYRQNCISIQWSQHHQRVAIARVLARLAPNRNPTGCHGLWCLVISTLSSQTTIDSGPHQKTDI